MFESVWVNVPEGTVVRDVHTGDTIVIEKVLIDSFFFNSVTLRNGRRHALSFTNDSSIAYQTTNLARNGWTMFNLYNYGIGCIMDQALETSYRITPKAVTGLDFQKISPERRQNIEDSLRKIQRYSIPHSIIDGRTNFVVSMWVSMSITGPQAGQFAFFNIFSYGIGVAPLPYIQVFYDVNSIFTSNHNWHPDKFEIISHNNVSRSFGVALQEPRYGLFGAWRYGLGKINSYSSLEGKPLVYSSDLTTYALSLGFYGQWGKIEYRHMRITSFSNPATLFYIPDIINGVYWSLQVMLWSWAL